MDIEVYLAIGAVVASFITDAYSKRKAVLSSNAVVEQLVATVHELKTLVQVHGRRLDALEAPKKLSRKLRK